jgi:hypothetical protein
MRYVAACKRDSIEESQSLWNNPWEKNSSCPMDIFLYINQTMTKFSLCVKLSIIISIHDRYDRVVRSR